MADRTGANRTDHIQKTSAPLLFHRLGSTDNFFDGGEAPITARRDRQLRSQWVEASWLLSKSYFFLLEFRHFLAV